MPHLHYLSCEECLLLKDLYDNHRGGKRSLTCTASSVRNAGSAGPSRTFLTPDDSSVSSTATAFCSNQLMSSDRGRLLMSVSNAWIREEEEEEKVRIILVSACIHGGHVCMTMYQ